MAKCPYCGKEIPANSKFCICCGQEIPDFSTAQAQSTYNDAPNCWHCEIPGIFGFPSIAFSGIPKWTAEAIHEMNPSQLGTMLKEIKETARRRMEKVNKAVLLKEEYELATSDQKPYQKPVKVFMIVSLCCIPTFFFFLLLTMADEFFGTLCAFSVIAAFALFVLCMVFKSKQIDAIRERKDRLPGLKQALENAIADMVQDVQSHGDEYVSAVAALPSYWSNIAALDYFINALQNHRALTLGDAINLYEKDKNDKQLQGIMYQQLAAQQATAAAASAAAYNTKVAAMAAVDIAVTNRQIAGNTADTLSHVKKATESSKKITVHSDEVAKNTWAIRYDID